MLDAEMLEITGDVVSGAMYAQDWLKIGVPPVHPDGDDEITVLAWVLSDWHAPQPVYVQETQIGAGIVPEMYSCAPMSGAEPLKTMFPAESLYSQIFALSLHVMGEARVMVFAE